jgi:hypothetical protein
MNTLYSAWPPSIQKHLLGQCRKCYSIISDDTRYGRIANKDDKTLCDCCEVDKGMNAKCACGGEVYFSSPIHKGQRICYKCYQEMMVDFEGVKKCNITM